MRATTETLEANTVKLLVEIDEEEARETLDDVVKAFARQANLPGFRPGKVPVKVLEARMGGANALRGEAVREAVPNFYAKAVVTAEIDPIEQPSIEITGGEEGGTITFEATVVVRPEIEVEGYGGLTVVVPSPVVSEDDIAAQIDRLREADGELNPIERALATGDFATIDLSGAAGDNEPESLGDDVLYRVGTGSPLKELDDALVGAKAGDTVTFGALGLGDIEINYTAVVKETKEQVLPELTDEWVAENTEFDTVDALRDDVTTRLSQMKIVQAQMAYSQNVQRTIAAEVPDDVVPDVLVQAELSERVQSFSERLQQQNLSLEQFLRVTGQTSEQLVAEIQADAVMGVKVDLALRAIARAEGLFPSEDEVTEEIESSAVEMGIPADRLRKQINDNGRTGDLKAELAKRKTMAWLNEHLSVTDEAGNPVDRELLGTNQADHDHVHDHDHAHDHDHDHDVEDGQ